jgi:membrane protease YdiL (CAAX protease family)
MAFASRLRAPLPLLLGAVITALAAEGVALWASGPSLEPVPAAVLLGLGARSLLWWGLAAAVGLGLRGAPMRAGLWSAGVALGLVTGAFSLLVVRFVPGHGAALTALPDPASLEPGWLLALASVAVVLAPLGEEALFRGALFAGIREAHGDRAALLGSAGAFALFHLDPPQLLVAGFAGLALGWLRLHGGRLWPCVLAHALHNLLWLGSAWL